MKIVIVDDDCLVTEALKTILEQLCVAFSLLQ